MNETKTKLEKLTALAARSVNADGAMFYSLTAGISSCSFSRRARHSQDPDTLPGLVEEPVRLGGFIQVPSTRVHPDYRDAPWAQGDTGIGAFIGHELLHADGTSTAGTLIVYHSSFHLYEMEEMRELRVIASMFEADFALHPPARHGQAVA